MFAFSLLGGTIDCCTERGIYVFNLHIQLYHFVPSLVLWDEQPKFLLLYFNDAQHEKDIMTRMFTELRYDVIEVIMQILEDNPYSIFFRTLQHVAVDEKYWEDYE